MSHASETLILYNAKVWAGPLAPRAEAAAMAGGRFAAVGTLADVREAAGAGAREIDLGGRLVLPGFIDSHTHFLGGGGLLCGLDLGGADCEEEFVDRIHRRIDQTAKGGWVIGGGWDTTRWPGAPLPHKRLIDGFSREIPIYVSRADGHIGLANSRALAIAGITRETADPPGGRIDRDARGEPTGILRDAAIELVRGLIPEPDDSQKERWIRAALAHAARLGVTGVVELDRREVLGVYRRFEDTGELTCRISRWLPLARWREAAELARSGEPRGELVEIGGVKAFADGSLGARTAWIFEPYTDEPDNCGLAMAAVEDGTLEEDLLAAHAAGLQLAVHAIGDRANAAVLDIFERIDATHPRPDRRFRIEHAQHLRREDIARLARLGVIASVQPPHIPLDGPHVERALGPDRARLTYAFRSLVDAGVKVAFGTDWPVVGLSPLETIEAAVTRRAPLPGGSGVFNGEQRVSVEEAVRCYTTGSAYAQFAEDRTGSIAPGKCADLVVLSDDIFEIDPANIGEVAVEMTVCGGRVVYGGPAFS